MSRRLLVISLLLVVILIPASKTVADEIGLISIESPEQLNDAKRIFGKALARVGNSYLVQANSSQLDQLSTAGLIIEIILEDADYTELALVRAEKPDDISAFSQGVELDAYTKLLRLSPTLARSLSGTTHDKIIPLEDHSVRFHYDPPINKNLYLEISDFPSDSIADLISQDSLYAFDQHLQNYSTRYVYTNQINQARDWAIGKFQSFGYTNVSAQQFYWNSGWRYNVMVIKEGYLEPDKVIVVGGHYDSWNSQSNPYSYAPGADDNGSGSALTLELARVMADIPTRKTIIFMLFTAEEVGLVGSDYAAEKFADDGTDIEVMYNFDMVGYDPQNDWELEVQSGPNDVYLDIHRQAASRVTSLVTFIGGLGGSSDHASFHSEGFSIVNNIEGNFNTPGWHSDADLTANMNFPFFADVARAGAASVLLIAQSPPPQTIQFIADAGDGQALEINWGSCLPAYTYNIYYGTFAGARTDSVVGISGVCSWMMNGLTTGQKYHFQVFAETPDGYQSPFAVSVSETPLVIPRAPANVSLAPELNQLELSWTDNIELDFAYYDLYRKEGVAGSWVLYQTELTDISFIDVSVSGGVEYFYRLIAVDESFNESGYSETVSAMPATFDQGVLIVDETRAERWCTPDQLSQQAWFDTIFSFAEHGLVRVDTTLQALKRNDAGPYSSIFWLDDDFSYKDMIPSTDTVLWYTSYGNNLFIAGWKTIWGWSNNYPLLEPGDFLYDEFLLDSYQDNFGVDFIGASGQFGWPTVTIDPSRGYLRLSLIPKLDLRPGGQVIYTFDSYSDNPNFEGQPVGVAYDGPNGKRVLLSFPLYYLTVESATNLISKAMEYFGEEVVIIESCCGLSNNGYPGDFIDEGNGLVDLVDITGLIDYLYISGEEPSCLADGNVNADPNDIINLSDLVRLIDHVYVSHAELPLCGSNIITPSVDSGQPDSLMILTSQPEAGGNDSLFILELWLWNDVEGVVPQCGFSWESESLTLDSTVLSSDVMESFDQTYLYDKNNIDTSNANNRASFVGISLTGGSLAANMNGHLLATYYFHVADWSVDDSLVIHAGGWHTSSEALFVTSPSFNEYIPTWRNGSDTIVIFDPNSCMFFDSDGDGVNDCEDVCPGFDDSADSDSDAVPDACDNCPDDPNPLQEDADSDSVGDACESCCGEFTGSYTGNTNCDTGGLRDLADITKLIDNVYISKEALCCPENGNTNGDAGGLVNLADITKLIDHVYITKVEIQACQ